MTATKPWKADLTPRQLEVLRVYAETGSARKTGYVLGISPNTVKQTLAGVRTRLRVTSTIQAAMLVFGGDIRSY